jgi:hypothetical protein
MRPADSLEMAVVFFFFLVPSVVCSISRTPLDSEENGHYVFLKIMLFM